MIILSCDAFILSAYKLSDHFAKSYFHKYWTEIHDVTTIWKRNVCSFIAILNAFDVRPTCDTADVQAILPFPPFGENGSNMVATSCISTQYLWKYDFAKSSDNLYAPCIWCLYLQERIDIAQLLITLKCIHMFLWQVEGNKLQLCTIIMFIWSNSLWIMRYSLTLHLMHQPVYFRLSLSLNAIVNGTCALRR